MSIHRAGEEDFSDLSSISFSDMKINSQNWKRQSSIIGDSDEGGRNVERKEIGVKGICY